MNGVNVEILMQSCNERLDYEELFVYIYLPLESASLNIPGPCMKSKVIVPLIAVIGLVIYYVLINPNPQEVSMLLVNGVVHTVNEKQPMAEAVAIREGKIVGVGSTEDVMARFKSASVIDLKGKPVYPGFIDAHAHLENLGAALMNLNVSGTSSIEEIQKLVADRVAVIPPGRWIRGRGWDQNRWQSKSFPTYQMLDAVSRDVPVYLTRIDGHAMWVNKKVLDIAGVTRTTPDPEGGRIVRDGAGNPTGVFIDNAVTLLEGVLPEPSDEERTEAIERAVQECIRLGLTEVHDMGTDLGGIEIYKKLIQAGRFPFRVYAAIGGERSEKGRMSFGGLGETWDYYLKNGPEIGGYDGRLTVRALKLYADGALGSRGAALIEPYSDDAPNRGLTLTSTDVLKNAAMQALQHGFQLCVHAIGDRGNNIVLGVYEDALKSSPKSKDARFRVEHAQVLDQADIPRFHQLGVLPVMQPTHCTSDMYWAENRLGPVRVNGAYAWRSLLDAGSIVPSGSDFPVESPNPLWGFYAAITRQDHAGWPEGGWHPEQRMSRIEALKSFTIWAAFASFEEKTKGSIEPGKLADLVVLSDDIMTIEPRKILDTTVELNIIAGEVVSSVGSLVEQTSQPVQLVHK